MKNYLFVKLPKMDLWSYWNYFSHFWAFKILPGKVYTWIVNRRRGGQQVFVVAWHLACEDNRGAAKISEILKWRGKARWCARQIKVILMVLATMFAFSHLRVMARWVEWPLAVSKTNVFVGSDGQGRSSVKLTRQRNRLRQKFWEALIEAKEDPRSSWTN